MERERERKKEIKRIKREKHIGEEREGERDREMRKREKKGMGER